MKSGSALLDTWKKLGGSLVKYKYLLIIAAVGIALLLMPPFGGQSEQKQSPASTELSFDLTALETKLAAAISEMDGAGRSTVALTVKAGARQVLAQDVTKSQKDGGSDESRSTVVVASGTGLQTAVALQQICPQFQGALVVCQGADQPVLQLQIAQAVSALTGLGADKISICKGR